MTSVKVYEGEILCHILQYNVRRFSSSFITIILKHKAIVLYIKFLWQWYINLGS